ncbi:hypothetical protein [uncultured Christiangramia sp.]|uniref:hypothetical protein n=1 Tax=Christiangramia sp. 3-2217-3z TaxID=3417564 RepID=UPI0026073BC5|nr:hypothetical protein [uncultured Christiangramia sp.]
MDKTEKLQKLKERQILSLEGMKYGVQRIDLLIVSISGAGIYVCLEALKFLKEENLDLSSIIKYSGLFLALAIIINFISQFLGHKSNEVDWRWCEHIIDCNDEPSKKQKKVIDNLDDRSEILSDLTIWSNYLSALLMFIGLGMLIYYFTFIF